MCSCFWAVYGLISNWRLTCSLRRAKLLRIFFFLNGWTHVTLLWLCVFCFFMTWVEFSLEKNYKYREAEGRKKSPCNFPVELTAITILSYVFPDSSKHSYMKLHIGKKKCCVSSLFRSLRYFKIPRPSNKSGCLVRIFKMLGRHWLLRETLSSCMRIFRNITRYG